MTDETYDDIALERLIHEKFGTNIDVDNIIVRSVDVSRTAQATVFLNSKKQLFCFVTGAAKLQLGDIQKIVSRMGLKAELYMPPRQQTDYFDEIGREKFREVFPGRGNISDNDIRFYRTLAPYNPALVLVNEVRDGHIYQYDSDASGGWRVAIKFAYRRIKTS